MQNYQKLINEIAKNCNFKFLTMDKDGSWFIHLERPFKFNNGWGSNKCNFLQFLPPDETINWEEAIFEASSNVETAENEVTVLTGTKAEKYFM